MSRALPRGCAWCGLTLARQDYILTNFRGLKGSPVVGWHLGCNRRDPAWRAHEADRDGLKLLGRILARSESRIVSRYRTSSGYGDRDGLQGDTARKVREVKA